MNEHWGEEPALLAGGGRDGCCAPRREQTLPEARARDYATIFRALADETRVRIVDLLARRDEEWCVCDIVGRFTLGQPTISHHLGVLRRAGLVTASKRGLWVYYRLNRARLGQIGSLGAPRLSFPDASNASSGGRDS